MSNFLEVVAKNRADVRFTGKIRNNYHIIQSKFVDIARMNCSGVPRKASMEYKNVTRDWYLITAMYG